MMDAVSATIVNGGQAICKITQVVVELNNLRDYFNNLYLAQPKRPQPTPSEEITCIGLGGSMDPTP
jgi:hypothetical protein